MEEPRKGYGLDADPRVGPPRPHGSPRGLPLSESGLRDEVREATEAIDTLIDEIGNSRPIRDAADEARDAVEESRAALEAFREDPNAETRQALLEADPLNHARTKLDGALEDAPAAIRESLGDVIDGHSSDPTVDPAEFED